MSRYKGIANYQGPVTEARLASAYFKASLEVNGATFKDVAEECGLSVSCVRKEARLAGRNEAIRRAILRRIGAKDWETEIIRACKTLPVKEAAGGSN